MSRRRRATAAAFAACVAVSLVTALAGCGDGATDGATATRAQIRGVGSSTVYPFATAVAEQFVNKNEQFKSPIIESTGTGAGFKLFCAGVGARHPDVQNASRRIKASEYAMCAANGVDRIVELQIGLDGIAFGESPQGLKLPLTVVEVYRALAKEPFGRPQTARSWADVNPKLPDAPIKVFGPPSTSGTRDALAELILTKGCESDPAMKALKKSDEKAHKRICTTIREDGGYVDAGENDNLIVQKVEGDPRALGIFGFSFLEENRDRLAANTLDGVAPTYAAITDFSYPGARPLYVYVKQAHVRAVPGLREFVAEFASAWGPEGYLKRRGMVVAPADVIARSTAVALAMTPLDPRELK